MKSKKNKMKLSRKKNNIKGYNKIIRGGASLTAAKAATNPPEADAGPAALGYVILFLLFVPLSMQYNSELRE